MLNTELISRLLKYNNVVNKFKSMGFVKVFSDNIGDAAGVSSSQVRKDFSVLKIIGNKRGGYQVDELITKLSNILGKEKEKKVVVVGCGNIGRALIGYKGFGQGAVKIAAGFDSDATKIEPTANVPIYPMEELETYIKKNNIEVGVIAVPDTAAADVYEKMLGAGIKGVLNFARVFLREAEGCVVNTINIELKLENLFYFVNALVNK